MCPERCSLVVVARSEREVAMGVRSLEASVWHIVWPPCKLPSALTILTPSHCWFKTISLFVFNPHTKTASKSSPQPFFTSLPLLLWTAILLSSCPSLLCCISPCPLPKGWLDEWMGGYYGIAKLRNRWRKTLHRNPRAQSRLDPWQTFVSIYGNVITAVPSYNVRVPLLWMAKLTSNCNFFFFTKFCNTEFTIKKLFPV